LYCGIWWGWVGGVVAIIEAAQATPVVAMDVSLGLVRFVFAGIIGIVSGLAVGSLGIPFLKR
jgi:hypothetical protein